MSTSPAIKHRRRISTLLLGVLASIAGLVLIGLVVITTRLIEIQDDLGALRDSALPRLVKLSRLSQEASATISIAPALSAKPTRFEFETLLSRIKDKEASQRALIEEIKVFIRDDNAARILGDNGDLLMANLRTLTDVVRQQIDVRKRLERHIGFFRGLARSLSESAKPEAAASDNDSRPAGKTVFVILSTMFDPNSARFSRNKKQIADGIDVLSQNLERVTASAANETQNPVAAARKLIQHWTTNQSSILEDKQTELSNEFKIKSLVEENSLIANRLLSSANRAFWGASAELETQIGRVDQTTRFTLVAILVVVAAFGLGILFVWLILKKRVFARLTRIGAALQAFADHRERPSADTSGDEIGAISDSLAHYMTVIDTRESELAEKTNAMEQLSNQLAKYLSPQVYDSIFSGKQEVKVASSRKKLTIFFSDIAGFTETADRMESEELTQLINHYLTEMSRIALEYGATIDKYVGDAILIFLGDPETKGVKEDALSCVKMAIAMQRRLNDLADTWRDTGIGKPLQVRMGIHTGFCTVGNFGSEDRMDYTIIGGAVNTASRLESVATPGEILISYETFALVRDEIHCMEHGEIDVKGIAYPIATYLVLDSYENLGRQRRHLREDHPNVKLDLNLDAMTKADRSQAADILRQALASLSSEDEPTEPEQESKPTPPHQS